jgi:hypothetical protein
MTRVTPLGFHAALALNGIEMEDRVLTIKRAKGKMLPESGGAGGGAGGAAKAPPVPLPLDTTSRVVYVGNLSWEVDEESLGAAFEARSYDSVCVCHCAGGVHAFRHVC